MNYNTIVKKKQYKEPPAMKIDKAHFWLFVRFLRYLIPYRKKQIAILVLSSLTALSGLVTPYLSKLIVDKAILNKDLKALIFLGFIATVVFILSGLARVTAEILGQGLYLKVQFDINKKIFQHLQSLPLTFFQDKSTGEHMFKISYDIERASDSIVSIPKDMVSIFPRLFFILIIILHLDWQMALFSLCLVPILYVPIYYLTRQRSRVLAAWFNNSQNLFKRLQEIFSHMYLVKAFGKEEKETKSYLAALISNIRIRLKNIRLEMIGNFVGGSLDRVIVGLIALFGGYQVITGRISAGTLTAIMIYLAQLVAFQGKIIDFGQRVIFGLISCKRLDEILQQKQRLMREANKHNKILSPHPRIEFKKVWFGYGTEEYILKDVSFEMEQGIVALAGLSGCGKTTIINLILGLYEQRKGTIFIDGHSIEEIGVASLQEQVGVALQEPYLWNDTIEANIKYAKKNVRQEEVIAIAKLVGVNEFVKNLPQGYATVIGENACKLSEGQKQKIAIARALLKKPKILILDEAMASMDSLSEEKIMRQIKQLPISLVIIISHRVSSVLACDRAYYLERPETMITGTPQELIKTQQSFYNLFAAQLTETL